MLMKWLTLMMMTKELYQCIDIIKKIYPNDEDYFLLMVGIEINENIPEMSVDGVKF